MNSRLVLRSIFKFSFVFMFIFSFNISANNNSNYLGCFKDQNSRDLSGSFTSSSKMTAKLCVKTCKSKGYKFAGTQFASQCFCGNTYGKSGKANNCNMNCTGNQSEKCGGSWANSVYKVISKPILVKPIYKKKYLGCFKDQNSRDLKGTFTNSPNMTTNKCVNICGKSGYKFAGTQFASQCFCGNTYGKSGKANNCNMNCTGNKNEKCGGTWANSIYKIKPVHTQKTKNKKYLGCFKDQNNRDLKGTFTSSSNMTTNKCVNICRKSGYKFAGTQYASQCFCGNTYGKSGKANNCNMNCSGNKNEKCGGTWANSIYEILSK